jgi:hypothetical protein
MLVLLSIYLYKFQLRPRMGKINLFAKKAATFIGLRQPVLKVVPVGVVANS